MSLIDEPNTINGIDLDVLGDTICTFQDNPSLAQHTFRVTNRWVGAAHNESTINSYYGSGQELSHKRSFVLETDEPEMFAGEDEGVNPVEQLLGALASCMTTSMVSHAAVHGITIEKLETHVDGDIDLRGYLDLDDTVPKGYTEIRVNFKVKADTDDLSLLWEFATYSPVYHTLMDGADVNVKIQAW